MSSVPTPDEIARDARWLVQALDPNARVVRIVEMDREAYREVSFLDDRMFRRAFVNQIMPWDAIAEASQMIPRRDARWIFHISHVGSTLLSRMLGEVSGTLPVREPRFLRDLARIPEAARARFAIAAQALFARTFSPGEIAVIKTTSFVSEIASDLVPAGGSALLLFNGPRNFVSNILAGENSLKEVSRRAEDRARRLQSRHIRFPEHRNDADGAAAAWACEMTSLEVAADRMPDRHVGWIDFDRFLEDIPRQLKASAEILDISTSTDELVAIANGPLVGRYSKALEYEYSPDLRRQLLADSNCRFGREIDGALAMLRAAAEKSPLLARSLARCGEA